MRDARTFLVVGGVVALVAALAVAATLAGGDDTANGSLPVSGVAVFTLTFALADCAAPDASAVVASANVTSQTADPNPAPNNSAGPVPLGNS